MGLFNLGNAFFQVESPDIAVAQRVITRDLISFSITEEFQKIDSGAIQLLDPNHYYARMFNVGTQLTLAWGYSRPDEAPQSLLADVANIDEIRGPIQRRGTKVRINSPNGGAGPDGIVRFNAAFYAVDLRGDPAIVSYTGGTKATVVRRALDELGAGLGARADVRFAKGGETIDPGREIRRTESVYRFLVGKSFEWRAIFRIGFDAAGLPQAMFVDPDKVTSSPVTRLIGGGTGRSTLIDYGATVRNVIEYSWKNQAGDSGFGDNVTVEYINGEAVFTRFIATSDDKVQGWRLVPERIEAELQRRGTEGGAQAEFAVVNEILEAATFEDVKRFFEPVEAEYAPQGLGYLVNVKMLGNPLMTAGQQIAFGGGFPQQLGSANTKWYARKVTHSIDASGYFTDVEIVDAFTLAPGSGVVLGAPTIG